jgi:hypothetical protein
MSNFKTINVSNYLGKIDKGEFTTSNARYLDISGNGFDQSGTQILKVAYMGDGISFYCLNNVSNNFINKIDCSGFNIIRVLNNNLLGIGYISNPESVTSFVTDLSNNLWVGGINMNVKTNSSDLANIDNTKSMFIVPFNIPTQPFGFTNADISGGCKDICQVNNLMFATVGDISGVCLNHYPTGTTVPVDTTIFPRIRGATTSFNVYIAPSYGGTIVPGNSMDLSGHSLVAFRRTGNNGYDVSGFYIVRSNTNDASGNSNTPSTVDGFGSGIGTNIKWDLSLNKLGYDRNHNLLYLGTDSETGASSKLLLVPLDNPSAVYQGYDISNNAIFAYGGPTSTDVSGVDGSGFMFVCPNPAISNGNLKIYLDSSGIMFNSLKLKDVSGIISMASLVAYDVSNNLQNYLFLVDASRNQVGNTTLNYNAKIAQIMLSTRTPNTGTYSDGSGIKFIYKIPQDMPVTSSFIRDIKTDILGNIFIVGHELDNIVSQDYVNGMNNVFNLINVNGPINMHSLVSGAFTNNFDLVDACDPRYSPFEVTKWFVKPSVLAKPNVNRPQFTFQ